MTNNIFGNENVYTYEDVKYKGNNCCLIKLDDVTESFALKITQYIIAEHERTQVINCLNDKNHIIAFGADITRVNISGFAFKDDVQPVYDWYTKNRAYKEVKTTVLVVDGGNNKQRYITFKGYATDFTLNFSADNIGIANYTISLIGVKE